MEISALSYWFALQFVTRSRPREARPRPISRISSWIIVVFLIACSNMFWSRMARPHCLIGLNTHARNWGITVCINCLLPYALSCSMASSLLAWFSVAWLFASQLDAESNLCFPVRALSRFQVSGVKRDPKKRFKNRCSFRTLFWEALGSKREPRVPQKETILESFWNTFWKVADFVKMITVSCEMLIFAASGSSKRILKSKKNVCPKKTP